MAAAAVLMCTAAEMKCHDDDLMHKICSNDVKY